MAAAAKPASGRWRCRLLIRSGSGDFVLAIAGASSIMGCKPGDGIPGTHDLVVMLEVVPFYKEPVMGKGNNARRKEVKKPKKDKKK